MALESKVPQGVAFNENCRIVPTSSTALSYQGTTHAFTGDVTVSGNITAASSDVSFDDVTVDELTCGALTVAAITGSGNIAINTNKFTVAASTGNTLIAGTASVTGDVAVATNKFTVAASSGNTVVAGTLGVTGAVTASAGLTAPSSAGVTVGTVTTAAGHIYFGQGQAITGATTGQMQYVDIGANTVDAHVFLTDSTKTTGKMISVVNNVTEVFALLATGKTRSPTTVVGTATLVNGTVTVSTAAVKTADFIFCQLNTPGGTLGTHYKVPVASIVDATSFVITACDTAGSVVATDTSTVNWWIVDQI